MAPEESMRGLMRGSMKSKWANRSGKWKRRWNEQVNNDRRGRAGNGPGRGKVSLERLAPILGRSMVNIQRR